MKYILLMLMCASLVGCDTSVSEESIPPMPEDFNFKLNYGFQGLQEIDTFSDTVVKDLVLDGTIETSISLEQDEMESIYQHMMAMDIMEVKLQVDGSCRSEPEPVSRWKIVMNGETKSFHYTTLCPSNQLEKKFLQLERTIQEIVEEKPEYKELPSIKGGYE